MLFRSGPFNIFSTCMYIRLLSSSIYFFSHQSCPAIMQLVCITHFLCLSNSFFLRLPCPPGMFQGCAFHWCGLHRHSSNLKDKTILLFCVLAGIHLDGHKAYYFYRVTVMNATIHYCITLKTPILSM